MAYASSRAVSASLPSTNRTCMTFVVALPQAATAGLSPPPLIGPGSGLGGDSRHPTAGVGVARGSTRSVGGDMTAGNMADGPGGIGGDGGWYFLLGVSLIALVALLVGGRPLPSLSCGLSLLASPGSSFGSTLTRRDVAARRSKGGAASSRGRGVPTLVPTDENVDEDAEAVTVAEGSGDETSDGEHEAMAAQQPSDSDEGKNARPHQPERRVRGCGPTMAPSGARGLKASGLYSGPRAGGKGGVGGTGGSHRTLAMDD